MGSLLYYARVVDITMLVVLDHVAAMQSCITHKTLEAAHHIFNYAATHPDAIIRYHGSSMILHSHSDASYLSAPKSRSRAGGYFFGREK